MFIGFVFLGMYKMFSSEVRYYTTSIMGNDKWEIVKKYYYYICEYSFTMHELLTFAMEICTNFGHQIV
jgi:hypothetical protein